MRSCLYCNRATHRSPCKGCKHLRKQIHEAHKRGQSCRADQEGREERVRRYAAIVAAGGKLFE